MFWNLSLIPLKILDPENWQMEKMNKVINICGGPCH